jgi:predicted membrane metal-binding protein
METIYEILRFFNLPSTIFWLVIVVGFFWATWRVIRKGSKNQKVMISASMSEIETRLDDILVLAKQAVLLSTAAHQKAQRNTETINSLKVLLVKDPTEVDTKIQL